MALLLAWNDARTGLILADAPQLDPSASVSAAIFSTASGVIVGLCGQLDACVEAERGCRSSSENMHQIAERLSERAKQAHREAPADDAWPFGAMAMGIDAGCVRQVTITGGMISWSPLGAPCFAWVAPNKGCNERIRSEGLGIKDAPAEEIASRLRHLATRLADDFPEQIGKEVSEASLSVEPSKPQGLAN